MRQIKFRAWVKGHWAEESYETPMIYDYQDDVLSESCGWADEENFKIMQFTGLLDKNGKEIYEGDVIKGTLTIAEENNMCYDFIGAIIYEAPAFVTDNSDFPLNIYDSLEILGNIYENPELLERVNSI